MAQRTYGTKFTVIMTLAVLAGFATILLMNMAALIGIVPSRYISPNDVRGMAVEHEKLLYTLNFDQQNTLVDIFNRAIPVTKESAESRKIKDAPPLGVQKIIIYRFNAPDIEIIPVDVVAKTQSVTGSKESGHFSIVFASPLWNDKGYLEESAGDELHKFLQTTYGP